MAFNFFGFSVPSFSLPSLPSLPKISLPKVSLPNISLPKIPKITLPKISVPGLPKVSLPTLPGGSLPDFSKVANIPKEFLASGSAAVDALNLAAKGILPMGMRAGTKAANQYLQEQADRVRWAAEAAAEAAQAAGRVGANIPKISLPTVTLPKVSLPKVSLPNISLPKVDLSAAAKAVSLPAAAGAAVAGAVTQGSLPKIDLPKIALPDLSNVPGLGLVSGAGAAAVGAVQSGNLPKITLPDVSKVTLPPLPGLDVLSGAASIARGEMPKANIPQPLNDLGGWASQGIDSLIGARDQSYSDSTDHIAAGNYARGGGQFAATAAADVILPLDLLDAGNKWMSGRGDQIDGELALWAAIDAVSLAAAPFTFGASYAAARAAKAGKVALKTAKVGGEVGKTKAITKAIGAVTGASKSSGAVRRTTRAGVRLPASGGVKSTANISAAMWKQAEAAQKQYASLQRQMQQQYSKVVSALGAPKSAPTGATKGLGAVADAVEATGKTSKSASALGKTGTALKYTGLGLGVGAIGLTALGALGGPASQDVLDDGMVPLEEEYWPGEQFPGVWPGNGEEPWWTLPDLPGYEWPEMPGYDPTDPGYYDPGYYDPAYPDPFGWEPYAQDFLTYGEGVPGIGGLATAAKENGLALPALVGAVVLVVLVVAFLRSKKGKAMIGGAKKQVNGAVSSAKKAVTGA